ncbi:MAG TPA: type II toxin-antitoxin system HicB family antitoxin [Thermoanaerobaculia bacterium]|nr:type II toxin-antitoxin system HicB family antitoxin [Thermoanaerobaculia bacterium]
MSNTVFVGVKVRGVARKEGDVFVAGFPRLDVYSQGETLEEAKANAEDALRLWVESCVERNTLRDALIELGWHLSSGSTAEVQEGAGSEHIVVMEESLGEPWESTINVPAYQAAELLSANG